MLKYINKKSLQKSKTFFGRRLSLNQSVAACLANIMQCFFVLFVPFVIEEFSCVKIYSMFAKKNKAVAFQEFITARKPSQGRC